MKTIVAFIGILVFIAFSSSVRAEEKKWSDEAELSFVDAGGNTETTTLSAKNHLKYLFTEQLEGEWKLSALYGQTGGEKNAENYSTNLRMNYLFTKRFYAAGNVGWEKDEFAGIDNRYYLGPSVGYKFLTGPKHLLLGETGLDYVKEEYTDNTDNNFIRGRIYGQYVYAFSEKTKLKKTLEFLYDFNDSQNFNINSETSLTTLLSDQFSLKTSYEVKYDNDPTPETLHETDTILSVALVVNF